MVQRTVDYLDDLAKAYHVMLDSEVRYGDDKNNMAGLFLYINSSNLVNWGLHPDCDHTDNHIHDTSGESNGNA